MKASEALDQMKQFSQQLKETPRGSVRFTEISDAYDQFMFTALPERDFDFIMTHLDHDITDEEIAALIAGAYNQEDITTVVKLDPEIATALKFRVARRERKLTQQQVAERVGNLTQGQVAKAELALTSLTIDHWNALFKAIGAHSTIGLGY